MTHTKTLLIIPFLMAAAVPTSAGSPDNPGAPGKRVTTDKSIVQGMSAPKSEWGDLVSMTAKGESPRETRKLGEFLQDETAGPNPANDEGQGND